MTATETATTISPDELAENLPDIMTRVHKHHERFVVRQGDDVIMRLEPPVQRKGITVDELISRIGNLKMPGDGFADDLEAIHASQGYMKIPEWPD
jgi:hypothetical protein